MSDKQLTPEQHAEALERLLDRIGHRNCIQILGRDPCDCVRSEVKEFVLDLTRTLAEQAKRIEELEGLLDVGKVYEELHRSDAKTLQSEIDRIRKALEQAPHEDTCCISLWKRLVTYQKRKELSEKFGLDCLSPQCDCRKRAALGAVPQPNLNHLRNLQPGWDNYCAAPITEAALKVGEAIMNTRAQVVPTSTGGIQIEWHCGGVDIEIVVLSDGTIEDESAAPQPAVAGSAASAPEPATDKESLTVRPFRVGRKLGTTIYHGEDEQPCAITMGAGAKELAALIVRALNATLSSRNPCAREV